MPAVFLPVLVACLALVVALAVDRWWGEPPVRFHPVVWMGNYLGWAGRHVQAHTNQSTSLPKDLIAFWLGALAWIGGAAIVVIASFALQTGVVWLGDTGTWVVSALLLGLLLKSLLAWALLKSEVQAVEAALSHPENGSLQAGRERLRWLVSRDVTTLSESQVRESAIETLAENLNDSVIAPLFWFALLGLPGAALFRFANTADAMWGYPGLYPQGGQGHNWAWAGKCAARADDVLAWVPARITALLLMAAAAGAVSMKRLRTEATRTPSPNSGWPMAAMALGLGVRLGKPGGYVLNADAPAPRAQDTLRAIRYASNVVLAPVGIGSIAIVLIVLGLAA